MNTETFYLHGDIGLYNELICATLFCFITILKTFDLTLATRCHLILDVAAAALSGIAVRGQFSENI